MVAATDAVESGGGVLFIVKNYAGDIMNFEMASEMLDGPFASVVVDDDVALAGQSQHGSARRRRYHDRREDRRRSGRAGADLATCKALGDQVVQATASMGVALTDCAVPALGKPMFALARERNGSRRRYPRRSGAGRRAIGSRLAKSSTRWLQPSAGKSSGPRPANPPCSSSTAWRHPS